MAKGESSKHKKVHKQTKQGGDAKLSTMNKQEKRSYKKYRGQGR
jgi:hypothetical protein